jgi:hypothetical protein
MLSSFETVLNIVPAVGVIVALVYYAMNVRNANITRKSQLAMNFYTHVTKKEFWEQWTRVLFYQHYTSYQEWDQKYGPTTNPEAAGEHYTVCQMFVGAGTLLKERVIEPRILFKYLPQATVRTSWEKFKSWIEAIRIAYNDPEFCDMFEYLYEEAKRLYPHVKNPRFDNPERKPSLIKLPTNYNNKK